MKLVADRPVAVIALAGAVRPQQAFAIEDALSDIVAKKQYKIIVDFAQATHVSSSVIGVLARFAEVCAGHHGELRLVATDESILNLLRVTMLDKVFIIFDSVAEAEEDF